MVRPRHLSSRPRRTPTTPTAINDHHHAHSQRRARRRTWWCSRAWGGASRRRSRRCATRRLAPAIAPRTPDSSAPTRICAARPNAAAHALAPSLRPAPAQAVSAPRYSVRRPLTNSDVNLSTQRTLRTYSTARRGRFSRPLPPMMMLRRRPCPRASARSSGARGRARARSPRSAARAAGAA